MDNFYVSQNKKLLSVIKRIEAENIHIELTKPDFICFCNTNYQFKIYYGNYFHNKCFHSFAP